MTNKKLFYWASAFLVVILIITLFTLSRTTSDQPSTPDLPFTPAPEEQIIITQSGRSGRNIALAPGCEDKDFIRKEADYIIEGIIKKVENKRGQYDTVTTYSTLLIERQNKGTPFTKKELQIVTNGVMTDDGTIIPGEDQPIFHEGKKIRIHLENINNGFSIVCAFLGVEEI